jgi:hypothetical protein
MLPTPIVQLPPPYQTATANAPGAMPALPAGYLLFGGTTSPQSSSSLQFDDTGKALALGGSLSVTSVARSGLTAGAPFPSITFNLAATKTWATGALASQADFLVSASTHAFSGASTETNAATFAISGPPIAGANCTQVNPLALHVRTGKSSVAYLGVGTTDIVAALTVDANGVDATQTEYIRFQRTSQGSGNWYNSIYSSTGGAQNTMSFRLSVLAGNSQTSVLTLYNGVGSAASVMASFAGNVAIGSTTAGASAAKTLALSNGATAPSASADLCHLYSADNGAGHATLAIYCEEVVDAVGVKTVTEVLPVFINGTLKNIALAA